VQGVAIMMRFMDYPR